MTQADTAIGPDTVLQLPHLVVREEGAGEFVVGSVQAGVFFSVPAEGARMVELLAAGHTVGQTAAIVRDEYGVDIDVEAFAHDLAASGLLAGASRRDRSWAVSRVPAAVVAPLFSRAAWVFYVTCFVGSIALFLVEPDLLPTYEALFVVPDMLISLFVGYLMAVGLSMVHEVWHALAGAAIGIRSRLRFGRRAFFAVLETDLTGLWTVPVNRRYGPLLAGMAIDSVWLFGCVFSTYLWSRGLIDLPPLLVRLMGLGVLFLIFGLTFQALAFLRTDLYLVLATAIGAQNLHRVTLLSLRRMARRSLTADEQHELDTAHPRDLRLARWYRLLYLAGAAWLSWFFLTFAWPSLWVILSWLVRTLASVTPAHVQWWEALLLFAIESFFLVAPILIWARERFRRLRAEPGRG